MTIKTTRGGVCGSLVVAIASDLVSSELSLGLFKEKFGLANRTSIIQRRGGSKKRLLSKYSTVLNQLYSMSNTENNVEMW